MITANRLIFVMSGTERGGSTGVRSSIDLGRVFLVCLQLFSLLLFSLEEKRPIDQWEADIIDIAYFWVVFRFDHVFLSHGRLIWTHLCKVLFPFLFARTKKLGGDLLLVGVAVIVFSFCY